MKGCKTIVSVTNDLYTDQRVHKVCSFLTEQGYEVLLVGRLRKNSRKLDARSYRTKRMRLLFDKGALFYAEYNLRLFLFLLFRRANLLVSNDLDTLLANYTASCWKRRCRLVYDSHEFYTGVPELVNRPRVQRIWERIEKRIFPKLKTVYTVNESIADIYRKLYRQEVRVVRNISPRWNAGEKLKSKPELGIPEGKFVIIMQGAGINVDRGGEEAVEAMRNLPEAVLLIVGDGDVVPQLKTRVVSEGLSERVLFFGRRPYAEMMNFTWHADLGLTLDKDTNPNYRFSLPNKLFDYIHTETPVLATNLVEVARIVKLYGVGEILDSPSPQHLEKAIREMMTNPAEHERFRANCRAAREQLSWERETEVLKEIYPRCE